MAVKRGFRSTEVGVIPVDWDVKRLGDLGTVVRGGSPRPAGDPRYFNGNFIPWLTVASLTNIPDGQMFVTDTATKLTEEGSHRSRRLESGLLVIVNSGARTLGVTKILGISCCANDGIAALLGQRDGDKRFLCFFLNSQTTRLREVIAAGNDQLNLNTGRIALLAVPFPKLPEQHAIAEALSDVDELLAGLDRLIAKKRDLKQAAMQQLLTGQTRLPGFKGKWEVKRLGDVLRFQVGFPFSSLFFNEYQLGQRLVKNRDLKSDDQVIYYSGDFDPAFRVNDGDVLIGMDGDFLPCLWSKGAAILNQRVGRIQALDGLDITFAYYYLREPLKKIERATSSTTVKHLSHDDVAEIQVPLPDIVEQRNIGLAIADIDAELAALEARRDKTRALKQGMMQELLTGRTRLV